MPCKGCSWGCVDCDPGNHRIVRAEKAEIREKELEKVLKEILSECNCRKLRVYYKDGEPQNEACGQCCICRARKMMGQQDLKDGYMLRGGPVVGS